MILCINEVRDYIRSVKQADTFDNRKTSFFPSAGTTVGSDRQTLVRSSKKLARSPTIMRCRTDSERSLVSAGWNMVSEAIWNAFFRATRNVAICSRWFGTYTLGKCNDGIVPKTNRVETMPSGSTVSFIDLITLQSKNSGSVDGKRRLKNLNNLRCGCGFSSHFWYSFEKQYQNTSGVRNLSMARIWMRS